MALEGFCIFKEKINYKKNNNISKKYYLAFKCQQKKKKKINNNKTNKQGIEVPTANGCLEENI